MAENITKKIQKYIEPYWSLLHISDGVLPPDRNVTQYTVSLYHKQYKRIVPVSIFMPGRSRLKLNVATIKTMVAIAESEIKELNSNVG